MTGGTGLLLWVITGAALVAGLVGIVNGVSGTDVPTRPFLAARLHAVRSGGSRPKTRLAAGAVAGAVVWAVTGVFVAGVLVLLAENGIGTEWIIW